MAANNNTGTKDAYDNRLAYKEMLLKSKRRFIDLWYDMPLYGKINLKGETVYNLQESTLKQLNTGGETIFAIDFVADAFSDMRNHIMDAVGKNRMSPPEGNMRGLNPKKGWLSSQAAYEEHMQQVMTLFVSEYLVPNDKKIKEFKDILVYYERFLKNHAKDFPMSLSYFISSGFCPIQTTGLVIELDEFSHGDDNKNLEMINSPWFPSYVEVANRYGFYVNRNAPWALVANLSSRRLHSYMKTYGLDDPKKYFQEYTYPAYKLDMQMMKNFIENSYATFVGLRPYRRMKSVTANGLKTRDYPRKLLTSAELDSTIKMSYWFKLCIMTKIEEMQLKIHPTSIKRLIEHMMYLRKRYWSIDRALAYMNEFFKKRDPRINLLLGSAPNIRQSTSAIIQPFTAPSVPNMNY